MAKKKQKTNAIRQVEQQKIAYNEYTYEWLHSRRLFADRDEKALSYLY